MSTVDKKHLKSARPKSMHIERSRRDDTQSSGSPLGRPFGKPRKHCAALLLLPLRDDQLMTGRPAIGCTFALARASFALAARRQQPQITIGSSNSDAVAASSLPLRCECPFVFGRRLFGNFSLWPSRLAILLTGVDKSETQAHRLFGA